MAGGRDDDTVSEIVPGVDVAMMYSFRNCAGCRCGDDDTVSEIVPGVDVAMNRGGRDESGPYSRPINWA